MKHEFTQEQIDILKENPYTLYVGKNELKFTATFKREVYRLRHEGVPIRKIYIQLGYDPAILGRNRMYSQVERILAKDPNSFRDPIPKGKLASKTRAFEGMSDAQVIKKMEYELRYLRQEVEILKKVWLAESSQQQK